MYNFDLCVQFGLVSIVVRADYGEGRQRVCCVRDWFGFLLGASCSFFVWLFYWFVQISELLGVINNSGTRMAAIWGVFISVAAQAVGLFMSVFAEIYEVKPFGLKTKTDQKIKNMQ